MLYFKRIQLEEGQWKDHKKKIDELQKKINKIEKNQELTGPQEKVFKELDEKNKQVNLFLLFHYISQKNSQDYKNNLVTSAWAYQDLMHQKEQLEKALKNSVVLSSRKITD